MDAGVLAVGEQHHHVAGRVEEIERLEQPDALLDRLRDDRALVREQRILDRIADERDAQQDVVVVVRERRDHVGLVAELDQRHQVAVVAVHAQPHEPFGRGDGGEERRVGLGAPFRCAALNGVRMLVDASIITAMRRPGIRHFARDERRVRVGQRQREERQPGRGTAAAAGAATNPRYECPSVSEQRRHDQAMPSRAARTRNERATSTNAASTARPRMSSRPSPRCQNCRSASRTFCHSATVLARYCRASLKDIYAWLSTGDRLAVHRRKSVLGKTCWARIVDAALAAPSSASSSADSFRVASAPVLGAGERRQAVAQRLERRAARVGLGDARRARRVTSRAVADADTTRFVPRRGPAVSRRPSPTTTSAFAGALADGSANGARGGDASGRQGPVDQVVGPALRPRVRCRTAASSRVATRSIVPVESSRCSAGVHLRGAARHSHEHEQHHQSAERDQRDADDVEHARPGRSSASMDAKLAPEASRMSVEPSGTIDVTRMTWRRQVIQQIAALHRGVAVHLAVHPVVERDIRDAHVGADHVRVDEAKPVVGTGKSVGCRRAGRRDEIPPPLRTAPSARPRCQGAIRPPRPTPPRTRAPRRSATHRTVRRCGPRRRWCATSSGSGRPRRSGFPPRGSAPAGQPRIPGGRRQGSLQAAAVYSWVFRKRRSTTNSLRAMSDFA